MRMNIRWVDGACRDARYAIRSLIKNRSFATVVVLTLSVGIGTATAMWSVVKTILLDPLPFEDAHRLVRIVENDRPRNIAKITYAEYLDWQKRTTTLTGLATVARDSNVLAATPAGLSRLTAGMISPNYFDVLAARPMLGGVHRSADSSQPEQIVLGFYAWKRHFNSDPKVIGSVLHFRSGRLSGRGMTVIGVMPESMETIGDSIDVYAPIMAATTAGAVALDQIIGRLRDGVSLATASQEANVIGSAIRAPRPALASPVSRARFEAKHLSDGILEPPPGRIGGTRAVTPKVTLLVCAGAAVVVLLIVCANVAGLLLVRGSSRRRELSMRLALGASRTRLLRLILTECLVLAGAGGALGAALGALSLTLIKRLLTIDAQGVFRIVFGTNVLPRANEIAVDVRFFGAAVAIAAITVIVCGLAPALQLSRTNQADAIGSRSQGTTKRESRARKALVIGQLAMSTILLVASGLLATTFVNLTRVDKGYDPANVLTFQLVLPAEYQIARKAESIDAVLQAMRREPEITAAGFAYGGILIPVQNTVGTFVPPGRSLGDVPSGPDRPRLKSLSAGYLEATGVRLLSGRLLRDADSAGLPVAVINRAVQRRYFGDTDPVGTFMDWYSDRGPTVPVQVIGVIADVRQGALDREPYPEIFMDYRQVIAVQERRGVAAAAIDPIAFGFMSFAVRARGDPAAVTRRVRQAVTRTDPNAALDAISPLDRLVSHSMASQRFYAVVLMAFATLAALLAAIGLYGLLAFAVAERTREIGIRIALGAGNRRVMGMVLGRGMWLTVVGIGLGMAGAAGATRFMHSMLYGVTPLDPVIFLGVAVGLSAVAVVASYVPARRAMSVDPVVALRTE